MTDEAAEAFFRTVAAPRRRDQPRLAEPLHDVAVHRVSTPYGTVAAWRLGRGPATLLVHGWEDDNSLWTEMIAALVGRGHAVVVFDLPAHGFSGGETGLGFEAADAARAVSAALGPIEAIVAHSMSGGAAALAVDEGLPVRCCVLIAPPAGGGDRWRRIAMRTGVAEDVADRARAMYESRVGVERVTSYDLGQVLARLDADVMIVHSEDDEHMPVRGSQELLAQCPNLQLLLVSGHTHRRTARAAEATAGIVDFIERTGAMHAKETGKARGG